MRTASRSFVGRLLTVFSLVAASLAPVGAAALAQPLSLQQSMDATHRGMQLQAQQDQLARQAVLQQNQLMVLEAQIRTQQAIADIQARSQTPRLPPPPSGTSPKLDTSQLASIPDSKLAESNARVKAAANNDR
ncbi:hypothetical protein LJR225_002542 [Phenylobacterium sp. LjRoot225]|uniref:hypothetical protein n=1 Tax=Phenylobacterium sp. LjRoot225 TaxID=3342285 RepID=UPI003ECE4C28